jgi:DNA-binding NarL/FixJ family response regulator
MTAVKSDTTRVLVVEDHQVVAEGLAALINDQQDMKVVGKAGTVADSYHLAAELKPDIVLMDFRLTDGNRGRRRDRDPSDAPRDQAHLPDPGGQRRAPRFAALEAGASGFIHKSRAAQEVVDSIRTVAAGGNLFTPRGIAQLLTSRREYRGSAREADHAGERGAALDGRGNREPRNREQARHQLHDGAHAHRSLGSKLGVHSKLEAIVKARELALVE